MQPKETIPVAVGPNAALGATSASALSVNAPPVTPVAVPSVALSADFHHVISAILAPANLEFLKVMVIGAGAVAGKKAIELFVEQAKTWFSKKNSIEGFEITPPAGMTVDSLKIEGRKAVITLKALIPPALPVAESFEVPLAPAPALATRVAASLASPVAVPTPVLVSTEVSSLKKKKKRKK